MRDRIILPIRAMFAIGLLGAVVGGPLGAQDGPAIPDGCEDLGSVDGVHRVRRRADGMVMVHVPAGEFVRGAEDADAGMDERPARTLTLSGYWIDRTEVTWAMYTAFCQATRRRVPPRPAGATDDHPVTTIGHPEASEYAKWAGGALPTEAQWEKAARGTDGRAYPWGSDLGEKRANTLGGLDGHEASAPVGSFPDGASPYGCLDMAGNVWEWCRDFYRSKYYAGCPQNDPPGPDSGIYRTLRGGSWGFDPKCMRTTYRFRQLPDTRTSYIGFRCVIEE